MRVVALLLLLLLTAGAWAQEEEAPPPESEHASQGSRTGRFRLGQEGVGIGTFTSDPTALEGPLRTETVLLGGYYRGFPVHYRAPLGEGRGLLLEISGGPNALGADFSYSFNDNLTVNVFGTTSRDPAFENGVFRFGLPGAEPIYVRRYGGGIEYADELSDKFQFATALNLQQVEMGPDLFGPVATVDLLGQPLSYSPVGSDELLTLNAVGQYNDLDFLVNPTRGTRVRFQLEQAIPVGDSQINSTTVAANVAHLIPAPGPGDAPSYVLLNLQAGSIAGDAPAYRAFNLGGANSVRGYQLGGLGTGSSFVQTTVEYRGALTRFDLFGREFDMKGVLFFDYASDLGTANNVLGRPAVTRGKRGDGIGYGLGLYFFSDVGLFRFESGWNEQGQNQLFFSVGDRF